MSESKRDSLYKWLVLFVVVIGTFMSILDTSIVNIAISKLMAVFGVTLDDIKWVLTAYTLTLATIIPLTGYLGNVFGSKNVFASSLAVFTIGSFLCGFAWSNNSMIVFRIIQALGGAMIMPVGMTILMDVFEPKERGVAFGFFGIAAMAAPAMGPTLGGYIIERLNWRLIFYVNVPIGILGVIFTLILLKPSEKKPSISFDYIGFITSSVGFVSILYVLGEGSTIDWGDFKNPFLITLGCFSLLMFIVNELIHPHPLLDLRVLKIFSFSMSQAIGIITTFVLMGGVYVIPLFLQNFKGYTAMETGIIMLPASIATGIMMPISGKLYDKFGLRPVVIPGFIILGISSYILSFIDLNTSKDSIIFWLTIRGIGLGVAMMPISTAGLNMVPRNMSGNASALNSAIRQIGGALAITVMTTIINSKLHFNYSKMAEQVTFFNPAAIDLMSKLRGLFILNGYSATNANVVATYQIYGLVYRQSYIAAMEYALAVTSITIFVAIIGVMFMKTKKIDHHENSQSKGDEATHAALLE